MSAKSWEALGIGVVIWGVGAVLLLLLHRLPSFPLVAVAAALLVIPGMCLITRLHLRDVAVNDRPIVALRLGVVATAVQFPLDALALVSLFELNYPPLTPEALEAVLTALECGYFCLLVVPWWVGSRGSKPCEAGASPVT